MTTAAAAAPRTTGHLIPARHGRDNFGTSTARYRTQYVQNLDADTTQTFGGSMITTATPGTAGSALVTVTEYGTHAHRLTKLVLASFAVGTSGDNVSKAIGALVYTFPAGVVIVDSASLSVGFTLADAVQTNTPDVGLGTAVGTGAVADLGSVGATAEDIHTGTATADVAGTVLVSTKIPTANVPLIIPAASVHTVYLNAAVAWADLTAASALTATGTIWLSWRLLA